MTLTEKWALCTVAPWQPASHQGQELSAPVSLPPQGTAQSLVWRPQTARHTFTASVHEAPASRVGETKGGQRGQQRALSTVRMEETGCSWA